MLQGIVVQMRRKGLAQREGKRCTWRWIPQIVSNNTFYRNITFSAGIEHTFVFSCNLSFSVVNIKTMCDHGAEH
jgi:hypothetical protein